MIHITTQDRRRLAYLALHYAIRGEIVQSEKIRLLLWLSRLYDPNIPTRYA